jgi:hypothetical protein
VILIKSWIQLPRDIDGLGKTLVEVGDVGVLLIDSEGDLYAVKELLGHSSTRVTEVYLHSSRTRTVSATDALAAYRGAQREDGSR